MNETLSRSTIPTSQTPTIRVRGQRGTRPPPKEVLEALENALKGGNILSYPIPRNLAPNYVNRKALIIAPRYLELPTQFQLDATSIDALNVYKMLRRLEYEPENIRILCDSFSPELGAIDATVDNIVMWFD